MTGTISHAHSSTLWSPNWVSNGVWLIEERAGNVSMLHNRLLIFWWEELLFITAHTVALTEQNQWLIKSLIETLFCDLQSSTSSILRIQIDNDSKKKDWDNVSNAIKISDVINIQTWCSVGDVFQSQCELYFYSSLCGGSYWLVIIWFSSANFINLSSLFN